MTDRTISILVTLNTDYREDDAETIASMMKMLKGVLSAEIVKEGDNDFYNKISIRKQIHQEIYDLLDNLK